MALSFCGRRIALTSHSLKYAVRHQGYIVLIPEIGEDLPDKNPLLQQNGLPEFNNITIENCMAAIGKQTVEFEADIRDIENKIKKEPPNDIFQDVFNPLEIQGTPLNMTWGLSKTLYLGHSTKMPTKSYLAIHERAKRSRAAKFNSKPIYETVMKEIESPKQGRSEEQIRIIKKFTLEGKLNGLSLNEKKKEQLEDVLNNLNKQKAEFKLKTEASTKKFSHTIDDPTIIRELPSELVANLCEPLRQLSGPWKVTLQPQVCIPFMEYCPDRMTRWNVWQAMVGRGSGYSKKEYETSTNLETIRSLRHDQAKLLGYDTYVDMSMETKMAGNIENINNMLHTLLNKARPAQERELESLYEFAKDRGFEGNKIELWDLPYWKRKQRKSMFGYDEDAVRDFFPYPKVLNGLFQTCEKLFNITIKQRSEVSTWHKDVRFYDVFEDETSTPIAGFYLDPYADSQHKHILQSGWMVGIQNKSSIADTKPLAALVFNFKPPTKDKPCTLTFKDLNLLFHKFGHTMQHLLSRTTYSEVSGLSNIEWDAVEVCGHVLAHFLYNKYFIKQISSNIHNNEQLPDEMFKTLINVHEHTAGIDLCRELYLSALDIELHSSKKFWLDIVKALWPKYRAFPLDKLDSHPCSFTQIFCEEWAAAYYCHIWSRVIAADVYSAFHEVQGDENQLVDVGRRFRDTFLALGGACHPSQVFRKFRGRDPSPKALLSSLGLKTNKEEKT